MSIFSMILLSLSVSTDAFAASVGKGLSQKKVSLKETLSMSFIFGITEMLFLGLGILLGSAANYWVTSIDHWIAFVLLTFLGLKLCFEHKKIKVPQPRSLNVKTLFLTAMGTGVDSIAVGISSAFIEMDRLLFLAITGLITSAVCIVGIFISHFVQEKVAHIAEVIGGVCLIGIGLHILLSHLGLISF